MVYMDNLIFLDVDGVLNNLHLVKAGNRLNHQHILRLKEIVTAGNCDIVISSAWRKTPNSMELLKHKFAQYGLSWVGETPISARGVRQEEIEWWIQQFGGGYNKIIVIDDDQKARTDLAYFIHTNRNVGLTDIDVIKAKKILGVLP